MKILIVHFAFVRKINKRAQRHTGDRTTSPSHRGRVTTLIDPKTRKNGNPCLECQFSTLWSVFSFYAKSRTFVRYLNVRSSIQMYVRLGTFVWFKTNHSTCKNSAKLAWFEVIIKHNNTKTKQKERFILSQLPQAPPTTQLPEKYPSTQQDSNPRPPTQTTNT